MTTSLTTTLKDFQRYIIGDDVTIADHIHSPPRMPREEALLVYGRGYYLRLIEILEKTFTALEKLLGKTEFNRLARAYIDAYPSQHFSICYVGYKMAEFLRTVYAPNELLWAELADLDWRLDLAVEAPDAPYLTLVQLQQFAPEAWSDLIFSLHPSCQFTLCQTQAPEMWNALVHEHSLPVAQDTLQRHVVVWRYERATYFQVLTEVDYAILQAIYAQASFGDICEELLGWLEEEKIAEYVATKLLQWLNEGLLSAVSASCNSLGP